MGETCASPPNGKAMIMACSGQTVAGIPGELSILYLCNADTLDLPWLVNVTPSAHDVAAASARCGWHSGNGLSWCTPDGEDFFESLAKFPGVSPQMFASFLSVVMVPFVKSKPELKWLLPPLGSCDAGERAPCMTVCAVSGFLPGLHSWITGARCWRRFLPAGAPCLVNGTGAPLGGAGNTCRASGHSCDAAGIEAGRLPAPDAAYVPALKQALAALVRCGGFKTQAACSQSTQAAQRKVGQASGMTAGPGTARATVLSWLARREVQGERDAQAAFYP